MRLRLLVLALIVLGATACSPQGDIRLAEDGVSRFHERFNSHDYAAIYAEGDAVLREEGEAEFLRSLEGLREQYGDVRGSELTASNWQVGNVVFEERMFTGTFVVLAYRTEFATRPATERFTWRIDGGRALLMGLVVDPE